MIGIYIMLAICIVLATISSALAVILIKKMSLSKESEESAFDQNQLESLKSELANTVKFENAMLSGVMRAQTESTNLLTLRFDKFMQNVDFKLDKMKDDNAKNLAQVREEISFALRQVREDNFKSLAEIKKDNTIQLEKMRETVDEKLNSTIENRFNQSFKVVSNRLEEINRSFADLQNLQTGVNELKSIFKNVKTRGTWGEIALENLLSQILTDEQFEKNVNITKRASERVDFVIKLPGKGDGQVYLPIDCKFPIEDYQRLIDFSEKGDVEGVAQAGKALEKRIKTEAMSVRDKYIHPPKTTDYAIIYLPIESLFAEVIKRHGLVEELQNKYRIVVCGPTTIAALLNSLQMGFRSIAVEKRSTEIGKLMTAFIKDFEKFSVLLEQTQKKLASVQTAIQSADDRTKIIKQKLDKVSRYSLETSSSDSIEELASPADFDDIKDED